MNLPPTQISWNRTVPKAMTKKKGRWVRVTGELEGGGGEVVGSGDEGEAEQGPEGKSQEPPAGDEAENEQVLEGNPRRVARGMPRQASRLDQGHLQVLSRRLLTR